MRRSRLRCLYGHRDAEFASSGWPSPDEAFLRTRHGHGIHILLDARGAPFPVLDDEERVRGALEATVEAARLTQLGRQLRHCDPHGVTALALLTDSHLAIHTWPEHGTFAADLFHWGELPLSKIPPLMQDLATYLEATRWDYQIIERLV